MKKVKQWFGRRRAGAERSVPRVASSPLLMALEPRVVYDASVAAVAAQPHTHDGAHEASHTDTHRIAESHPSSTSTTSTPSASSTVTAPSAAPQSGSTAEANHTHPTNANADKAATSAQDSQHTTATEVNASTGTGNVDVVFIDPSVANYQTLIAGLPAGTKYVVLNGSTDGFAQIAQYVETHHDVSSIALISHGSDGTIQAGTSMLTSANFSVYQSALAEIGAAMKPGGDFLIYGCDVAQQADGQALVQQIAQFTHLNVAASTDATGAASLGGNWTLEYQAGHVHTALNESAAAVAQFDELLFDTNTPGHEYYDQAAQDGFSAVGTSQFTLDGIVYTFDQAANTFAYNGNTSPVQPPSVLVDAPDDGVLEINPDGSSALSNVTISLANGHTFNLQQFDLDSFNGDLYIQAHYANGTSSGLIQLAAAQVGGFTGTVQSQLGSAFNNIVSFSLIDQNDTGAFEPTLDRLFYTDTGPTVVTTTNSSTPWSSADNGVGSGGSPVPVDPGLTLSDGGSATAKTATVQITNVQTGDVLGFTAQNGITGSYDPTTGTLSLSTGAGTASIAQWQAALESVTFSSSLTSPNLNTTTRTVSFSFNDGTFSSNLASHNVTVAATDQTPVLTEGGATSTNYFGGSAATAIDANLHVSDGDNSTLASGTVTIASGALSGDTLSFTNSNSTLYGDIHAGTFNGNALTLTSSSGTATLAQWQAALDAVTFSSLASTPSGTRDITFSVNDGTKVSADVHHSVVVTSGPVITIDNGTTSFVSGDNTPATPVAVDPGLVVTDGGSSTLASATVQIAGNFQANHDELLFTNNPATMGDISATYNTGSGLLTLTSASGTASLAQWQAALRSVTFTNDLVVPSNQTRTISYQLNDGSLLSPVANRTVSVTDTDQTPLLNTSGGATTFTSGDNAASTPVAINTAITLTDSDSATMAYATVQVTGNYVAGEDVLALGSGSFGDITASFDAASGKLTLTSAGASTTAQWVAALRSVTYTDTAVTPNSSARTISFAVSDGTKTSATETRSITVVATHQTPVLTSGTSTNQDYLPGNSATTIDSSLALTDLNAGSPSALVSLTITVQVTSGFGSGDILSFSGLGSVPTNGISPSYDPATGTLTISSTGGTVSQWQSVLDNIQFQTGSNAPLGTRAISITISDGVKTSTPVSYSIDVISSAPALSTTSTGNVSFVAGDNAPATPVSIDPNLAVADPLGNVVDTAIVSISGNLHSNEDVLLFTNDGITMGDITGTYNTLTGVLVLSSSSGTATLAQWQSALHNVAYTDTAVTPFTATRTIDITLSAGAQTSNTIERTITVTATDQTPLITTSTSGSAPFVAADNSLSTPIVIDSGIALTDLDNNTLASAVVQIGQGFHAGEDVLGFINDGATMGNIVASYDAVHGTLTLTSNLSTATVAQWQAALNSVTYTDTAVTPDTTTRTISFSVSDGTRSSAAYTRTVTVADTDQTPIVGSSSSGDASFVAGDNTASTPIAIDPGIALSDLDNTTLASATVQIGSGFHAGEDVLGYVNDGLTMGNISASYNAATGTLTLTSVGGFATLAQWQAALNSVTYTDTAVTPDTATRTISFTVNDGTKTSAAYSRNVDVTAADQTPVLSTGSSGSVPFVAADNSASTPVAIDTGITVSDLDNTTLASATFQIGAGFHAGEDVLGYVNDGVTMGNISASYDAATGTLTLTSVGASATLAQWQSALRSVTYTDTAVTPDTSTRTISFTVNDGTRSSAPLSRNVTVADTDQTPLLTTGSTGSASFVAGDNAAPTPIVIDGGITLSDLDNGTLASATVQIGSGFHVGEDVIGFVNDGTSMGNITASYDAATGTLTLSSSQSAATLTQWQAALRSVTYTDTAIAPDASPRSIGFTVSDGTKTSATLTRTVTVADADQTPLITSSNTGAATLVSPETGSATPVVIDNGVTLSDLDNTTLASATVQIGTGFHTGQDTLAFSNNGTSMGNIVASYDAARGTLTLTSAGATATLAQWQSALRSVTYTDTADVPDTTTRSVGFSVNDGTKTSAVLSRNVAISVPPRPLSIGTDGTPLSYTANGDAASAVAVGSGLTLTDRNVSLPTSATVAFSGAFDAQHDVLAFTPGSAATGDITASYDATSGKLTLSSASRTATLAQWQAAIAAVTYRDSQIEHANSTRTLVFTFSDATATSAPATRTLNIVGLPQAPAVAPAKVGTPILPPTPPHVADTPSSTAPSAIDPPGNSPLILHAFGSNIDNVSNPSIVLNAFDAAPLVGAIPQSPTITFATHEARTDTLGRTHVEPLASIVPRNVDFGAHTQSLPDADVHPVSLPDSSFALAVGPLMQAAASHGVAEVVAELPDGRPLPAWLHYDAVRGVLTGKPPAGMHALSVTLIVRDAAGNATQRVVVLNFDTKDSTTPANTPKPPAKPATPAHADQPAAKASLAAQFARAHAALHVAHADAPPASAAGRPEQAS